MERHTCRRQAGRRGRGGVTGPIDPVTGRAKLGGHAKPVGPGSLHDAILAVAEETRALDRRVGRLDEFDRHTAASIGRLHEQVAELRTRVEQVARIVDQLARDGTVVRT
jgi:hypothetical protein